MNVCIFDFDSRAALIEKNGLFAVDLREAMQWLCGNGATGTVQLERADQHLQQHTQIPHVQAEADEQEALADALERSYEAVRQRRSLRDDREEKVQQVVLTQHQG